MSFAYSIRAKAYELRRVDTLLRPEEHAADRKTRMLAEAGFFSFVGSGYVNGGAEFAWYPANNRLP